MSHERVKLGMWGRRVIEVRGAVRGLMGGEEWYSTTSCHHCVDLATLNNFSPLIWMDNLLVLHFNHYSTENMQTALHLFLAIPKIAVSTKWKTIRSHMLRLRMNDLFRFNKKQNNINKNIDICSFTCLKLKIIVEEIVTGQYLVNFSNFAFTNAFGEVTTAAPFSFFLVGTSLFCCINTPKS